MNFLIKIGILKNERAARVAHRNSFNKPYYYYSIKQDIQANDLVEAYFKAKGLISNSSLSPGKYRLNLEEKNFQSVKLLEDFKVK